MEYNISPHDIVKFSNRVEKYHNPLATEGESFSYDQNVQNIFKLLIFIVNNHQKEISINSHAEFNQWIGESNTLIIYTQVLSCAW